MVPVLALGMIMPAAAVAASGAGSAAEATGPVPVFNVRDYGATGDGKTDDLPAAQKALVALSAAGGGSLYFPKGTYYFSGRLEFRAGPAGIRVYGDGDTSVLRADSLDIPAILYFRDMTGVTVDHLRFVGSHVLDKSQNYVRGILLYQEQDTRIYSCTFFGLGQAVEEGDGVSGSIFTDNQVLDWGRVGYFVNDHCQLENNLFLQTDPGEDYSPTASSHCVYIHSNAQDVTVRGNTFRGSRYYGVQIYGKDPGTLTKDILIQGNTFENNASDLICYSETNTVVYQNIQVVGNTFRNTRGNGVFLGKGSDLLIADNQFVDIGNPSGIAIHMGAWDSGSAVNGGKVLRNTVLRTQPGDTQAIFLGTVTTQQIEVRSNWLEMTGRNAIYVNRVTGATIADNVIWMSPGNGDNDFANAIQLDELAYQIQITGNAVYGTGTRLSRGVFALPYPQGSSGTVEGNRFFGAPLTPGPLQVGANVTADLTGKPVTLFVLQDAGSGRQGTTSSRQVQVQIEGAGDATAWLLSETDVQMPPVNDPRWQTTKPTTLTLSDGNGVKRVLLWRKLGDGTVGNRPEVAMIELG
jgi:hypothetical protein